MGFGAFLAAAGPSLISGGTDIWSSLKMNSEAKHRADEQMNFQERMSSSAHQREVADLSAAGLNPILSAKLGGASSPGGAMAPTAATIDAQGVMASARENLLARQNIKESDSRINKTNAEAWRIRGGTPAAIIGTDLYRTGKKYFDRGKAAAKTIWDEHSRPPIPDSKAKPFGKKKFKLQGGYNYGNVR